MKTIKVPDYLHDRLKVQAEEWNVSIWQCIDDILSDSKGKTELEAVLEQMHMRFDSLECSQRSDPFIKAVESELRPLTLDQVNSIFANDGQPETKQEKFLRIKAEQEAESKRRQHLIDHPEDNSQDGGW